MGMLNEFKKFALRGNMIDMAVGLIVGAAFGKIVTSLVNDIVMPPIGLLLGNVDFSKLVITLREKSGEVAAVTINYGAFINTLLDFLIVAAAIFIVVKQMNRLTEVAKKEEAEAPIEPTSKVCPFCQSEIAIKAVRCPQCTSELAGD